MSKSVESFILEDGGGREFTVVDVADFNAVKAERDAALAINAELLAALKLARDHTPAKAIVVSKALNGPVDEAWVTAVLDKVIAKAERRTA